MQLKTSYIVCLIIIGIIGCLSIAVYFLNINQKDNLLYVDYNNVDYGNEENYVAAVIDGDTFILNNGETIRLLCVDTPEKSQSGYEEATSYLSSIMLGNNIQIKRTGIDKYNRTLAWVYYENETTDKFDTLVNKKIIDDGFGTLFEYNNTDCSKVK